MILFSEFPSPTSPPRNTVARCYKCDPIARFYTKLMTNTAIIGAGPYGLSLAAHFRRRGIPFRIFGRPMDSWRAHMPKGMLLKSDGFASNISDPDDQFTLGKFCAD